MNIIRDAFMLFVIIVVITIIDAISSRLLYSMQLEDVELLIIAITTFLYWRIESVNNKISEL